MPFSWFFRGETKVSDPIHFYHYTNRDAADSISAEGKIRNQGRGVLLTTLEPESYYRDEILQNNYGFPVPNHLRKNADHCVRVRSKQLIAEHLQKEQASGERLVYRYYKDIRVKETDVFDKPKCERSSPKKASDKNFEEVQLTTNPSASCSYSASNEWVSTNPNNSTKLQRQEIHVNLRRDIKLQSWYSQDYRDKNVNIFAFEWMKEALLRLKKSFSNEVHLTVKDSDGHQLQDLVNANNELSLKLLHILARNESSNTDGNIDFQNYIGISEKIVYSLKDLVRQTVIVGKVHTTNYGGYPRGNDRVEQEDTVYLCDLIGLQFQQRYNSGRLVIVAEDLPKGLLDDFIYEEVVREKKPTMEHVRQDKEQRFFERSGVFFDSKAYVAFVAHDITLAGLALNCTSTEPLNFKFLRYGTGYFGGPFTDLLQKFIGQGVAKGLRRLMKLLPKYHMIRRVELPFFDRNVDIDVFQKKHDIEVIYSTDDGLKKTHVELTTATTNCADPHAMTGNRMGFGSIDGAIAENLREKAVKFSPVINGVMGEIFI